MSDTIGVVCEIGESSYPCARIYTATGATNGVFDFSGGAPPTDGAILMAVLRVDPSAGELAASVRQQFIVWVDTGIGGRVPWVPLGQGMTTGDLPDGWRPLVWSQ